MKTRVATVLSLAGVLIAGSAAAVVNTQVLSGGAQAEGTSEADVVAAPSTATTELATSTTLLPPQTQATYQLGTAGTVTLGAGEASLVVVAASPSPGWLVAAAGNLDPSTVRVVLSSADTEVEFTARLLEGVVKTSVQSRSLGGGTATVGTSATRGSSDDAYDDDHDDRDRDDDRDDRDRDDRDRDDRDRERDDHGEDDD